MQAIFNPTRPSFRKQLLTFTAIGLVIFSFVTSMMIAWLVSDMTKNSMTRNGKQVALGLAEQSGFAIAIKSGENAVDAMDQVTSFPEVTAAQLISLQAPGDKTSLKQILLEQGDFSHQIDWNTLDLIEQAQIIYNHENYWVFAAPVLYDSSDSEGDDEDEEESVALNQVVGYSLIQMSKSKLAEANRKILIYTLLIGVGGVLILSFLINYGFSKLTQPLLNLAQVMLDSEKTGAHLRAQLNGPKEVQRMAQAYNSMMVVLDQQDEELRLHRDQLEAEVDIRTRELIEARDNALTANRHKSEFLANMTHELRTPIQAIIGYVDLVKEELEIEGLSELHDDLDKVTNNSQRLLNLINSVLDFAKVEAGKMDIHMEQIAISHIITNVKETVLPLVEKNNNQLIIVGAQLTQQINVDREKLEQILVNLLSNACKFTNNGKVIFDVSVDTEVINFAVQDTGIGISEDHVKGIFEEFQQVDGSQARKFQGTGLGLAICKRFCELLNADISVTSTINVGSTFLVKVPLKPSLPD